MVPMEHLWNIMDNQKNINGIVMGHIWIVMGCVGEWGGTPTFGTINGARQKNDETPNGLASREPRIVKNTMPQKLNLLKDVGF